MDYYSKYLKYKNKYTTLKLLKGGSFILSDNIILCGTHNNRLECFFKSIEKDYPNIAFNNCVIIRCYNENDKLKFRMIYEGEDNQSKHLFIKNAWTIETFNFFFSNRNYNNNIIKLPKNTDVLLIRHALGVHNKMSLLEKMFNFKKDSQLDVIGIEQSERAGIFLRHHLKSKKLYFMASHLIRTQQTIAVIMKMLDILQTIYIVPCAHELNLVIGNNCDCNILQKFPIPSNMPKCRNNNNSCDKLTNYSGVSMYNNYTVNINWDYYNNFSNNNNCQNTTILEQNIILYNSLNK